MKNKSLIIIFLISLFAFCIGWLLRDVSLNAGNSKRLSENYNFTADTDSSDVITAHDITENPYGIYGRYILKRAKYAGFNFTGNYTATWTNELFPDHPDSLTIRWINKNTFFTKDLNPINESCPPRVSIYRVVSYDGQKLVLKDLWTGWNDVKDNLLEFDKL